MPDYPTVLFRLLRPDAQPPTRGSDGAAGWDLCFAPHGERPVSPEGVTVLTTGVAVAIPAGYFGLLRLRSGFASKRGLVMASSGVIDCDYRGEIKVPVACVAAPARPRPLGVVTFDSLDRLVLEPKERFAQLLILPVPQLLFAQVDELPESYRGVNGFGSTGTEPLPTLDQPLEHRHALAGDVLQQHVAREVSKHFTSTMEDAKLMSAFVKEFFDNLTKPLTDSIGKLAGAAETLNQSVKDVRESYEEDGE